VRARLEADGYERTADQVARLARLTFSPDGSEPVATVPIPGGAVAVLAGEGFDPRAAERRLEQRRAKLRAEIERAAGKLADERFVAGAPPAIVAAERDKLARLRGELEAL
jgi:valyl-tRNA synthetase